MNTVNEVEAVKEFLPDYHPEGSERSGWPQAKAEDGWLWHTPAGEIPMPPMDAGEFMEFVEGHEKPWPKDDPRRNQS